MVTYLPKSLKKLAREAVESVLDESLPTPDLEPLHRADGVLVGTLIGWKLGKEFASIADAVGGMKRDSERRRISAFR